MDNILGPILGYILGPMSGAATSVPASPATWNPADKTADCLLSLDNTKISYPSFTDGKRALCRATKPITVKAYWETTYASSGFPVSIVGGVSNKSFDINVGTLVGSDLLGNCIGGPRSTNNECYYQAVPILDLADSTLPYTVGHAFDPTTGTYQVTLDGTVWNTVKTGLLSGPYYPIGQCYDNGSGQTLVANFGNSVFTYSVPSGFSSGVFG